jgi:transcriptional regulator of NAD metabolism
MNRSQLSQAINVLTAQIEEKREKFDVLLDDSQREEVSELVDLVTEREKLRGQRDHLVKTLQRRGMLI